MHIGEMEKVVDTDAMRCEVLKHAKAMAYSTIHELGEMHEEESAMSETDLKRIALGIQIIEGVHRLGK